MESSRLLAAAGAILCLLSCGTARAADGAVMNVIGYSPDSRYFAFEQYGEQDGSGYPFWDVFIIDLQTDSFVSGSPIHVVIQNEEAKLAQARDQARSQADPLLQQNAITAPAEVLAANPATEVVADRSRISFSRYYVTMGATPGNFNGSYQIRHELSLADVEVPPPANCTPEDGPYPGFSLTLKDLNLGSSHVIHKDESLPASRHCAVGYDLSAVVAPTGDPDTGHMVAIVGVYSHGFEGPDHRFIAVPFTLSD